MTPHMTADLTCSHCKKSVTPREQNASFPFCSNRCKMVDLGNWFNGGYALSRPIDPEQDSEVLAEYLAANPEDFN
ncbi:MAG: endogenous inhibitor of DNA gyrase (YacG/DUF329 family) [Myxococcota bacterium]|jgi:endogenous inhibitor of DNA gyrase (YacG/DUF329 family)